MNKKLLSLVLIIFVIIVVGIYFVIRSQSKTDLSISEAVETAAEDVSYEMDGLLVEEAEVDVVLNEMEDLDFDLSTPEAVETATEDLEKEISEIENEDSGAEQMLSELEDLSF